MRTALACPEPGPDGFHYWTCAQHGVTTTASTVLSTAGTSTSLGTGGSTVIHLTLAPPQ